MTKKGTDRSARPDLQSDEQQPRAIPVRLDYAQASPGAFKAMLGLEAHVRRSGLEHSLIELVKIRASQLNGCAFCLDMHTKDARAAGETE